MSDLDNTNTPIVANKDGAAAVPSAKDDLLEYHFEHQVSGCSIDVIAKCALIAILATENLEDANLSV
jgi:hypothetical protein